MLTAQNLVYFVGAALTATLGISALWIAATNRRFRWWATVAAVVLVVGTVAILVADGRGIVAVAVAIFGMAAAWSLGTLALRWQVRRVLDGAGTRYRAPTMASSSYTPGRVVER